MSALPPPRPPPPRPPPPTPPPCEAAPKVPLPAYYVFLDESGNFDFSPGGSKYLILCGVGLVRPFGFDAQLADIRFDNLEKGVEIERFHASEDKQIVRDAVFGVIQSHLNGIAIHAIVAQKNKANPSIRDADKFYPRMMATLMKYLIGGPQIRAYSQVIAIADSIANKKKAHAIRGATKLALSQHLPPGTAYKAMHHDSRSCYGLQVADYVSWAIGRKWEQKDSRSYALIAEAIRNEFDVFARGTDHYY